jgi:hypothetical protein
MRAAWPLMACVMAGWLWGVTRSLSWSSWTDEKKGDWDSMEVRLVITCGLQRTIEPQYESCTSLLMNHWDYKSTTVNGVTLMSMFTTDIGYWKKHYKWDKTSARCNYQDTLCRQQSVCEIQEQNWGRFSAVEAWDTVLVVEGAPGSRTFKDEKRQFCVLCLPSPCTLQDQKCSNGMVSPFPLETATEVDSGTGLQHVITKAICTKSCSPGYWLTCMNADRTEKCSYVVPTRAMKEGKMVPQWIQKNRMAANGNTAVAMSTRFGLLIDECYPCLHANGLSHYQEPLLLTDGTMVNKGFLNFYCPGGDQAPQICPENQVSKIDRSTNSSGPCNCMDGYYRDGATCRLCPAGYYCLFDKGIVACPTDTYSLAGATACTPCGTDRSACGPAQALVRCMGEKWQTQNAYCVDCQNCKFSGGMGGVPCQRVST